MVASRDYGRRSTVCGVATYCPTVVVLQHQPRRHTVVMPFSYTLQASRCKYPDMCAYAMLSRPRPKGRVSKVREDWHLY